MLNFNQILSDEKTLDPENWDNMRVLAHKMVDDMFAYLKNIAEEPVWRKIPPEIKNHFQETLPQHGTEIEDIYADFKENILPYPKGNIHPRFWAYVQGTGTPFAMMADMLASGLNANVTIGEHSAMYVDKQVIEWSKEMLNFPKSGSGILLSGASMANITGIVIARNAFGEQLVRSKGLQAQSAQLVMYMSTETHSCVIKAAEVAGIGTLGIRKVRVNSDYRMDIEHLKELIAEDRKAGCAPFCIVGNAGTVNTGAIDPLQDIADICKTENLWFHIDGAFGALAKLTAQYAEVLKPIEDADSVAFDYHKWMYMPYEVGCLLVKNKTDHRNAFAYEPNYLLSHERGLASGPDLVSNFGLELSRGFKALKVWMSLKEHGIEKFRALILQNIAQAFYLESLIKNEKNLELLTPVTLNVVCFRYNPNRQLSQSALNILNKEILMRLHEEGVAVPSYTFLDGNYVIRVANVNHRSKKSDFDALVYDVLRIGKAIKN
jgi:aromatic-L-amino-acid decarboxylase